MNLEELRKSGRIIFECIAGSHLYNLHTPKSDIDLRGIYLNPSTEYLGLSEPSGQIGDEKHDTTYYSLKRFFELAQTANPNILELLWVPDNCCKFKTLLMEKLMEHRDMFISKKCYHTHSGYSFAQIQKAKGVNKRINHPELAIKPVKEDFCYVIPAPVFEGAKNADINLAIFPMRPAPLKKDIDLSKYHAAGLEHVSNAYRLYFYGDKAKGVFRGDDMIVCESISIDDEWSKFSGLLFYNQQEYEKALNEHRKYNEWISNRNESRWLDQEKGLVQYDAKNMLHCMRLLISGENILRNGFPIVRFEGEQREYLMKIRRGEFQYEELMAEVEKRMAGLEELYKTSTIPHSVDVKKIEELYRELSNQ